MELQLLLGIAFRTTIIYLLLLVIVRLLGKRNLGMHSAFDLLVAILLANLASEAIFGAVSFSYVIFAVLLVAGWHYVGHRLGFHLPGLPHLFGNEPVVIIRDGEILSRALKAERITENELRASLRQHDIDDPADVKLAYLETSGQISVIRKASLFVSESRQTKSA